MTASEYERLEAAWNASPDAILLVDADGRITFANERVTDILGYEPPELVDEPVGALVPAEHRPDHPDLIQAYFDAPEARPMGADLDLEAVRKDGTTVPVDIALSPVTLDGERAVVTAVREVTDQVALERKYRRILDSVPDAVVVADVETGEVVEVNEGASELFGYQTADLVGSNQADLHPAGEAKRYRDLFADHVASGSKMFTSFPDGSDIKIETADGETLPVEINAHVFEFRDRRLIAGVFRDIRPRRSHAEALGELHSATRQLMSATSRETVAKIASETATSVLGLRLNGVHFYDDVADQLVPVAWSDAAADVFGGPPSVIPAGEGLAWKAFETGESAAYDDVRDVEGVLNPETPFRSETYLPLGEFGVMIVGSTAVDDLDETDEALAHVLAENVQAALERVEREQQLRAQNERLEAFTSVVSHDLRNPLNVAMGSLELAREDCDSDHLDTVERAHDRMADLIEDLLALAKQGEAVAEMDVVPLDAVGRRAWRHVETDGATLEVRSDRQIRADESRLRQLLENLFRNAIEHGKTGDGRVTVTIGDLEEGFYVADDGPGIPEEERDRLFEMGYSSESDGTGFGLAIVAEIADAHGWSVDATDSTGGGARVEFTGVDGPG